MPRSFSVNTPGRSLTDITRAVDAIIADAGLVDGAAHLFIRHTSASLLIQENADPSVQKDLLNFFDKLAPESESYWHSAEGPDDMPAHIKSALTASSLSIPVANGRLMLGTWQGIYLFEHRRAAHEREVFVSLSAEA